MKRRDLITLLGGSVLAWPLAARAQQPGDRVRRIGVLMAHPEGDQEFQAYVAAFREGLQKLGWIEGHNIKIDIRWGALEDSELRQRSAKELVALQPDVILTQNTPPTASMLQQTRSIPIIFVIVADPVGSGFVQNLARPAATPAALPSWSLRLPANWWNCSRRLRPTSSGLQSYLIPKLRRTVMFT